MAHKPEHKALVDSIIDEQLDTATLVEKSGEKASKASQAMMLVARKLVDAGKAGKVSGKRAREIWLEAWKLYALNTHVPDLEAIQKLVDSHLEKQVAETKKLGRPLKEVGAIRNIDIKARENEKKNAVDEQGKLDHGETQ